MGAWDGGHGQVHRAPFGSHYVFSKVMWSGLFPLLLLQPHRVGAQAIYPLELQVIQRQGMEKG